MHCIFCNHPSSEVIETRLSESGDVVRRRRQCLGCTKRFTTYERVDELPVFVIKRDGRRERFDRKKLMNGLFKSCEKTAVRTEQIEQIVQKVESEIRNGESTEIPSKTIGTIVARELHKLDKVAYIRFAAVFKRFVDIEDVQKEVNKIT